MNRWQVALVSEMTPTVFENRKKNCTESWFLGVLVILDSPEREVSTAEPECIILSTLFKIENFSEFFDVCEPEIYPPENPLLQQEHVMTETNLIPRLLKIFLKYFLYWLLENHMNLISWFSFRSVAISFIFNRNDFFLQYIIYCILGFWIHITYDYYFNDTFWLFKPLRLG